MRLSSTAFAVALTVLTVVGIFRAANTSLGPLDWILAFALVALWAMVLLEVVVARRAQPAAMRRANRHYLVRGVAVLVVSWAIGLVVYTAARDVNL